MDFNNDGILDLIVGERNGHYNFYTGNGDGTLHFVGHPVDTNNNPIQRKANSAGYLDDFNGDGYLDFIAGGYNNESRHGGVLQVHLNTGANINSPTWDASVIDLTSSVSDYFRQTHQTYDLDGDGDKDIILGYEGGNVWFAENIGTNTNPSFNGHVPILFDGGEIDVYKVIKAGGRARENVVDYNSDGVPDILVGCEDGIVYFFEGYGTEIDENFSSPVNELHTSLSEVPTTGFFSVNLVLPSASTVEISVYDTSGRQVEFCESFYPSGSASAQMDITNSPAGMYIVSVSCNEITETMRLIKTN